MPESVPPETVLETATSQSLGLANQESNELQINEDGSLFPLSEETVFQTSCRVESTTPGDNQESTELQVNEDRSSFSLPEAAVLEASRSVESTTPNVHTTSVVLALYILVFHLVLNHVLLNYLHQFLKQVLLAKL